MDERERDELLYRVDERTQRMEEELMRRLESVERETASNTETLEKLDDRVQRNETYLTVLTGGIGAAATAVVAKFNAVLKALGL